MAAAAYAQDAARADFAPLPTTTINPDLGYEAELFSDLGGPRVQAEGGVATPVCIGTDCTCEPIGGWSASFTGSLRYRGNLIRISQENVVLCKIKMELSFTGTVDLYVSIHRRQPDGTYTRIANDEILRSQIGTGAPAPYWTRCLNLPLPPGDYAIAYAWGSTSIRFAYDGLTYPRPFDNGTVLGSVAFSLANFDPPQPPVSENLPALQVFIGGAYAMELCFVPLPGACCCHGACQEKLAAQCVDPGCYFHGQWTLCAETPCEFGACCTDKCGGCVPDYTPQACAAADGLAHWLGAVCPATSTDLCPKVTGACCTGTSCVDTKCQAECIANGGTYRGDGTDCTPNICAGACCVTNGCFNLTHTSCTTFSGTYKGDGTACDSLPPALECGGACCFGITGLDSCAHVANRALCAYVPGGFPQIEYRGDYSTCSGPCGLITDYSACCLPDGTCVNTPNAEACTSPSVQGVFHLGPTCEAYSATCLASSVRCCLNDGSCQLLTDHACTVRGGTTVVGQTTCSPTACVSSGGACCGLATGDCTMTTRALCEAQGGLYQGDSSNCLPSPAATCPGFGACCRSDGVCFDGFSLGDCDLIIGHYEGANTACNVPPVECPQQGACCAVTDNCLFVDSTACAEIGGTFHGEGVACPENNRCVGACCNENTGVCTNDVLLGNCQGPGIRSGGIGSTCATLNPPCPPPPTGACCEPSGQCTEGAQASACAGAGQIFHLGTLCANVQPPCGVTQTGACCNENTGACTDGVAEANCQGANARFGGNGSTCATLNPPCTAPSGACCVEITGVCTDGVLPADCQAAGQRWGGAGVTCATLNPPCQPSCTIVSFDPPNCAIDARQPFPPNTPGSPQGWSSLALTFGLGCDVSAVTAGDFSVGCTQAGPDCPTITTAGAVGQTVTVNLSSVIPTQKWTCVTHTGTNKQVCLGNLPADANGDRTAAPVDILEIIDNLNGVRVPPLQLWQCDLDRSILCAPADILTEIDLLNGANGWPVQNGKNLPVCPSAP